MQPKSSSTSTSTFNKEYRSLVNDFRAFKQGACLSADSRMNEEAFYSNWESPGFGPTSGSNSNSNGESSAGTLILTPKSSDVSNSESPAGESEGNGSREVASTGRSRTRTDSSGLTPGLRKEMSLSLEQDELMEDGLPSHRPRKGHKKSRGGCYNCKRRKIKVRFTYFTTHLARSRTRRLNLFRLQAQIRANLHTVSRKSTSMSQLHAQESGLQISSSKNPFGFAGLGTVFC